jgi:hypothetical protein
MVAVVMMLLRQMPCGKSIAAAMQNSDLTGRSHWFGVVLRDLQFWIPVVVLIGGLLVLRWIA